MPDNTSNKSPGKPRPPADQGDSLKPTFLATALRTLAFAADEYYRLKVTETPIFIAPVNGFISGKDAEETRERLRTAGSGPLAIVLHARGGDVGCVFEIVHALKSYKGGEVLAYIPRMAYSGATMIALAATRIFMGKGAVLGPVDPQFGGYAASDIISIVKERPEGLDLKTRLLAIRAEKVFAETRAMVASMVETTEALDRLTSGLRSHNIPIPFAEARRLRLPVEEGVPERLFELLDAHLRASKLFASVLD